MSLGAVDVNAPAETVIKQLLEQNAKIDAMLAELNAVKVSRVLPEEKCERIDMTLDSGAAICAMPPDCAASVPLVPLSNPKEYTAANGETIVEKGIRTPNLEFANGDVGQIPFRVMDVNKTLLAVSACVKAKNRVVFQPDEFGGCYIETLTKDAPQLKPKGRAKKVFEKNGVYKLQAWVTKKEPNSPNARHGKCR